VVADVLAHVRIVSLFVAQDSLFFISFLMLLMVISQMMIFYPGHSKDVLKLSRILNNNHLVFSSMP